MTPLVAALAAMAILGGVLLVAVGLRPAPVTSGPQRTGLLSARTRRALSGQGRLTVRNQLLLAAGLAAGLLAWLVSGWVVAVVVLPLAFVGLPVLLMSSQAGASIDRLAAMEEWTRSLAGVLIVGVGLEQALIATRQSTPAAIEPEVATLVARLNGQWSTRAALRAFADDLDDATGDLIASSLLLGADRRGAGLASVLQGLAETVAEDVRIRRAIEADRAKPRATARWITLISIAVLALLALNGSYVEPYGTGVGQLMLVLLLGCYVALLVWMRRMAAGTPLPRFLGAQLRQSGGRA